MTITNLPQIVVYAADAENVTFARGTLNKVTVTKGHVELAAMLREYLFVPGMGETTARRFRDLGITTLYLTPVFPGRSNHRYDASTFDHVDPLLGGDAALASLTAAAHARGLRVVGDLTTNHTGAGHEWFAASADPAAPESAHYLWNEAHDDRKRGLAMTPSARSSSPTSRVERVTVPPRLSR